MMQVSEFLAANEIRKSARRKTNLLTADQKTKKAVANATRYRTPLKLFSLV